MKVAIFTDSYLPNVDGVAKTIQLLNKEFKKRGIKTLIVAPIDYHIHKEFSRKNGVLYFRAFSYPAYKQYKIGFPSLRVLNYVKEFKPDIVHVHSPGPAGIVGLLYAKFYNIPSVATFHTLLSDETLLKRYISYPLNTVISPEIMWKILRTFYNHANVVVSPTKAIKDELKSHGIKNLVVINNGIDISRLINKKKKNPKKFTILYLGRISEEKKLSVLLDALKIVNNKGLDFVAYFAGDGPDRQKYIDWVNENKLGNKIKFLGYVSERKKINLLHSASVFCFPSTFDTQSISVIEALASDLPVIAANTSVMREIIKNKCGILFRPNDPNDLANKILNINIKRYNPRACVKKYSISYSAEKYVELYNSLIKKSTIPGVLNKIYKFLIKLKI